MRNFRNIMFAVAILVGFTAGCGTDNSLDGTRKDEESIKLVCESTGDGAQCEVIPAKVDEYTYDWTATGAITFEDEIDTSFPILMVVCTGDGDGVVKVVVTDSAGHSESASHAVGCGK